MSAHFALEYWENVFCDLLIADSFSYRLLSAYRRSLDQVDQPLIRQQGLFYVLVLPLEIGDSEEKEGLVSLLSLADNLLDLVQGGSKSLRSTHDWELKDQLVGLLGSLHMEGVEPPEALRSDISKTAKPEQLPWTLLLSNFTQNLGKQQRKLSRRRSSKRYKEGSGQRWQRKSSLSVLLDISASISKTTLDIFMASLDDLLNRGHTIRLFQVDDRIRSVSDYRLGYRPELRAGGGTRFNKAIEQIVKNYEQDGLLLFTDGLLQENPCSVSIPHLWILDKDRKLPFDFGTCHVFLSNET